MPSVSEQQRKFMAAAAHNPQFASDAGIKQSVAQEFNRADVGVGMKKKLPHKVAPKKVVKGKRKPFVKKRK